MDAPPPPMAMPRKRYTRMTFFWGKNSEILFTGWPGTNGGYYALAIIMSFFFALIVEWLNFCCLTKPRWSRKSIVFTRTVLYTLRTGLAALIMLALMSFNSGVFLAIVFGHVVGYIFFSRKY